MLWDLEESDALRANVPPPEERARLDDALVAFAHAPNAGRPWREGLRTMTRRTAV